MSKDVYIQFEKPMTWEEYNSEEGQSRVREATKEAHKFQDAEDKKQERSRAERARVSAKIRAAFQSREHETGHER